MKGEKKLYQKWWLGLGVVLIFVLIVAIYLISTNKDLEANEPYSMLGQELKLTNDIKKELYEKVKNDITDSLKTPSTAIFPKMKEWNFNVDGNNIIKINSYVDSQNSYGAMLRADF